VPIGHEQSFDSSIPESGNETMAGRKVGNNGSMDRKQRAQKGANAVSGHAIVAEPHCMQVERNLAWRGSFRLVRGAVIGIRSEKMGRKGRCQFTG